MMSFSESISTCLLEKVVTLNGRATRAEYWWYVLFTALVEPFVYGGLVALAYYVPSIENGIVKSLLAIVIILLILCQILLLCSNVCAVVRRLHDTGKNGWWMFISFVPFVGSLILLVFLVRESEKRDNRYGQYPTL
jgi:uncharacterized membrane protein YhaH (DUF805 family)